MKKWLNKILHDKNDYHLDSELQNLNDSYNYFFQKTLEFQKFLIIRKIKYFLKFDKLVLLRIILRFFIKITIFLIFIGLVIFGLDYFNIVDIKPVPKEYVEYTVYIPDTVDIEEYKKNIDNPKVKFIIFFVEDSNKNYNLWKDKLSQIESGGYKNQYEARRIEKDENGNSYSSQYWGKYQMGRQARNSIGAGDLSWEDWKSNPELQEGFMNIWVKILYDQLQPEIKKYNSRYIGGWQITTSGLIAMAHNVGVEPVREFLRSGGRTIPTDGSGKDATRFLILGGYDLNE